MRADRRGDDGVQSKRGMRRAILRVALLAQLQAVDHRVGQFADAKLQRAAIADKRRGVQADAVVHRADRQTRSAVWIVLVARMIDDEVETVFRDDGVTEHERHAPVDRTDHGQRRAGGARCRQAIQQVQGQVRVRGKAVFRAAGDGPGTDRLGDHVDAQRQQVTCDVRVVGRQVVLLHGRYAKPPSRVDVELADGHVGR